MDRHRPCPYLVIQFKRYLNNLSLAAKEVTLQRQSTLKNAIAVFAYDNDFVDAAEERFIFDTISAILRFVKSVDTVRVRD